jgi:hypothetical protein
MPKLLIGMMEIPVECLTIRTLWEIATCLNSRNHIVAKHMRNHRLVGTILQKIPHSRANPGVQELIIDRKVGHFEIKERKSRERKAWKDGVVPKRHPMGFQSSIFSDLVAHI